MITPSPLQTTALRTIDTWFYDPKSPQIFYLAGYAGTGKTTLASFFLHTANLSSLTATYTGKAAHVLRQKGVDAHTIHSLVYEPIPYSSPVQFRLAYDSSPVRDVDILIIDESSMVSDEIAADLRALARRILVLGDPAQLPPIHGEGAFTRSKPDFFLDEIHRQALDSPILALANLARQGKPNPLQDTPAARVLTYAREHLPLTDPAHQLICGTHKHRWALTEILRAKSLSATPADLPPLPLPGEPLICLKNERQSGLYNGTTGTATTPPTPAAQANLIRFKFRPDDPSSPEQPVLAEDRAFREHALKQPIPPPQHQPYRRDVQAFDWAYALTCHKAQGSEWDHVTIVDDSQYFREDRHRWLYTALTRASQSVTLLRR